MNLPGNFLEICIQEIKLQVRTKNIKHMYTKNLNPNHGENQQIEELYHSSNLTKTFTMIKKMILYRNSLIFFSHSTLVILDLLHIIMYI